MLALQWLKPTIASPLRVPVHVAPVKIPALGNQPMVFPSPMPSPNAQESRPAKSASADKYSSARQSQTVADSRGSRRYSCSSEEVVQGGCSAWCESGGCVWGYGKAV